MDAPYYQIVLRVVPGKRAGEPDPCTGCALEYHKPCVTLAPCPGPGKKYIVKDRKCLY